MFVYARVLVCRSCSSVEDGPQLRCWLDEEFPTAEMVVEERRFVFYLELITLAAELVD